MAVIEKVYEGSDLVIPRSLLLKLGIKPGEVILIRPKVDLRPIDLDVKERTRLLEALNKLYGAWTEEDEKEFNRARKEMWDRWRLPNSSPRAFPQ